MTAEVKVEEKQVESEVVIAPAVVSEETTVKSVVEEEEVKAVEEDESKPKGVEKSASFKEESDFFADLKESEKKALGDLKSKLEEAIVENTLLKTKKKESSPVKEKKEEVVKPEAEVEKKKEEAEEKVEEEKKSEAVVTEEAAKDETVEVVAAEEVIPKEEVTTVVEKVEEEDNKEEEEKKTEDVVTEEVNAETIEVEDEDESVDKDIELWGVPLLPSKGAESTDVILLKFLRARDFKLNEAFEMLKKTLKWRKQHKIDLILGEDFGEDLASAAYMNGVDRESHPVCYNVHSEEVYQTTFGSEKNREKFLRWRFQLMEKGIQKLNLKPGGVTSLLQIHDLKNAPGMSRTDLWVGIKNVIMTLQDNYPEFVSRNIFINVPFWFYAINAVLSPFLTQRTKSKFVVARPAKVKETLLKYIPADELPVQYGGFKTDDDTEFSNETVSEVVVKPGSSETIEIPAPETEGTLVWDIAVLGWEVNYKEEFVPTEEGAYTVIVQKVKKMGANEGPIRNSFKNSQAGKIVLTVDNVSGKKKRVLYRYRTKSESSS
ncbi:CRAL/TRIO N-terminal domain [Arabidopsis thaliana x Arabidopsis arenosa]|uniref:CRAL/TRIO N-terminal domain n=1 Tax=Arabidopsis thaliana x Arabidopsis arenosa TaxID=1240361 RepID=A0A8T2CDU9_9BRAS|nr:CRAL/TRIO N-terminal domain [Arabidopsis thaliana x Arabidopsis arenosa]